MILAACPHWESPVIDVLAHFVLAVSHFSVAHDDPRLGYWPLFKVSVCPTIICAICSSHFSLSHFLWDYLGGRVQILPSAH